MKLPKMLKIGGHDVKIIFPYVFKERGDLLGQYDHDAKEIRINDATTGGEKVAESELICTFIHELFHAIDKTSGHRIFDDNDRALEGIAQGFYQVLVDNNYLEVTR